MRIIYSNSFDQHVEPSLLAAGGASLGQIYAGPQKLLGILENQLGLGGKDLHLALRIQAYKERAEALLGDNAPEADYFKDSFQHDGWSAAKQLLAWCDELRMGGWDGQPGEDYSSRLQALAAVDGRVSATAKRSLGSRFLLVIQALESVSTVQISRLQIEQLVLKESMDGQPPLIRRLFEQLVCYPTVDLIEEQREVTASSGDLGLLKQSMFRAGVDEKVVEPNLIVLRADNEWNASNIIAAWLKSDPSIQQKTVLIQSENPILDEALKRVNLPCAGSQQSSRWRASLQLLPLALSTIWSPLNLQNLVELLALKVSPIPEAVARRLLNALTKHPGIGGEGWQKAIEDATKVATKKEAERLIKKGENGEKAEKLARKRIREIESHLTANQCDPDEGAPPDVLLQQIKWVLSGLTYHAGRGEGLAQAISQAKCMADLVERHNAPISRVQLERMLDSVVADGGINPFSTAEASPWGRVDHPAALAGDIDHIVWWNFTDGGQPALTHWSVLEREALIRQQVELETTAQQRRRDAICVRNAVQYAGKQLILVIPKRIEGGLVQSHPLFDEIRYYTQKSKAIDEVDAETLLSAKQANFAGSTLDFEKQQQTKIPYPQTLINIEPEVIGSPEKLSYTQMSTLIGCPAKWALQYHARLKPMKSQLLPTGNQMVGTLCHQIVEDLINGSKNSNLPKGDSLKDEIKRLYCKRVPEMAAELLRVDQTLEYQRYENSIVQAIQSLFDAINRADLSVEEAEAELDKGYSTSSTFTGFADLLLKDKKTGTRYVIDLKWSSSSKYKKTEIKEGKALQLAAYAWLLRKKPEDGWCQAGYFMLAQGELLMSNHQSSTNDDPPPSLENIWSFGSKTYSAMHKQLRDGVVECSGLIEEKDRTELREQDEMMNIEPSCRFCDFGKICGNTRAAA